MPGTRDAMIITDVEKMAELKRFDEEITVYGSSFWSEQERKPYYVATKDLRRLMDYIEQKRYKGIYFTPITSITERFTIPSGAYEFIVRDMQNKMLVMLKTQYEPEYYALMPGYYSVKPNDNAKPYLNNFVKYIDGRFEEGEIMLLQKTIQYAYRSKILCQESYNKLNDYCIDVLHQMENDPNMKKTVNRTFFGFCFMENGERKNIINAQRKVALVEYEDYISNGFLTAPVLYKRYALDNYDQLGKAKISFKGWLDNLENDLYLKYLLRLKLLPGVVNTAQLFAEGEKLKHKKWAFEALLHYKEIWNTI